MAPNKEFYLQNTMPGHRTVEEEVKQLPDAIGPYRIESLLTSGGMSLLYLAKHPDKNHLLAIKVLLPKYVAHDEMKEQFLKEAEIIAITDHPNIVKLYGQGEWDDGLYIAMEFIQGITLRQFIVQHSLSLKRSLDIILQVSYALLHLHTHGVVHRDLKPENILITENGQVKVVDFGIAQLKDIQTVSKNRPGGMIGTPSYMSPEVKENPHNASYPSDIYSLGVIAYELIIGKLSFGNIQLNYLPKQLKKIIEKALAHEVSDRYQDIVDFITDVSSYLKNNTFRKERSDKDELKELLEVLSQSQKTLLPQSTPNWSDMEIGFAKPTGADLLGICYDFVKLPDQSYIIIIAETTSKELDATIYIAFLKGLIRMSLHEHTVSSKEFDPIDFISLLNEKLSMDQIPATFCFSALQLKPKYDQFIFITSGYHGLWHVGEGTKQPQLIVNDNPLLGVSPNSSFYEIKDTWKEGEQVFLHTFHDSSFTKEQQQHLEDIAKKSIQENLSISMQIASENVLKNMILLAPNQVDKNQKLVLSIQRID